MTSKDYEEIRQWLLGQAERCVAANENKTGFFSDQFFKAAEAIQSLRNTVVDLTQGSPMIKPEEYIDMYTAEAYGLLWGPGEACRVSRVSVGSYDELVTDIAAVLRLKAELCSSLIDARVLISNITEVEGAPEYDPGHAVLKSIDETLAKAEGRPAHSYVSEMAATEMDEILR